MSDEGGRLSQTGQVQVTECAHEIADQKLAMVYSSPMQRALESGRLAAEVLDIGHRTLDGLVEIRVGERAGQPWSDPLTREVYAAWHAGDLDARIPGAESGREVIDRFRDALETIADQQQWEFHQRKKRGEAEGFLTTGLFAFSRHPNFFFEQAQWWALFLFGAIAAGSLLQWTVLGAVLLTILFIGSTRFTEEITRSKYPEYADYQATTSPIVPWPPRRKESAVTA